MLTYRAAKELPLAGQVAVPERKTAVLVEQNYARTRLAEAAYDCPAGSGEAPVLADGACSARPADAAEPVPMFDLIELLFFAYRDFVGDADRLLENYRFGRAHHRVLHFVFRHPGLTVNALLDILKITKQSLNRVMKDLIDGSLIEVRAGTSDRRRRLLYPTAAGRKLALDLAALQSERFRRTLATLPDEARAGAVDFLLGMIDPGQRDTVLDLLRSASRREQAA